MASNWRRNLEAYRLLLSLAYRAVDTWHTSAGRSNALVYQTHEVRHEPVFCDAIPRASSQRFPPRFVPFIGEQSEDTRRGIDFAHFVNRPDCTLFWKVQVHKDHARFILSKHAYGFASGPCRPNDAHIGLQTDKCAEALK